MTPNREDIIRMAREAGIHVYPEFEGAFERFFQAAYNAGAATDRNKLAAWMIQFGFATGHGDTMEQLLDALGSEIVDRIEFEIDVAVAAERVALEQIAERELGNTSMLTSMPPKSSAAWNILHAIKARGQA